MEILLRRTMSTRASSQDYLSKIPDWEFPIWASMLVWQFAYLENAMKAVRIHQFGGPEVLTYEDIPDAQPRKLRIDRRAGRERDSHSRRARFQSGGQRAAGVSHSLAHAGWASWHPSGTNGAGAGRWLRRWHRGNSDRQAFSLPRDYNCRRREKAGQGPRSRRRLRHQPLQAEDLRRSS